MRQMRRLREAKIWPIGELPDDTISRIVGTVRPVGPALIAPLTGRECVWYSIYVNAVSETENDSTWQSESISFLLEDSSGRALVDPYGAVIERSKVFEKKSGLPTSRELEFLTKHGKGWGTPFTSSWWISETIVEVGETICVAGAGNSEIDPEGGPGAGYRTAPSTRMRLASSPALPMLITDEPWKGITL